MGSVTIDTDPGDFSFVVKEVNNEPANISVSISLASSDWSTTKSFGNEIWSSFSPTTASVGSQVCSGDFSGNGGVITATITVNSCVLSDLTWQKTVDIPDYILEENATLDLKTSCLSAKNSANEWTSQWEDIKDIAGVAKDTVSLVGSAFGPPVENILSAITSSIGVVEGIGGYNLRHLVDDMHEKNKETFSTGRTAIEPLAEDNPDGLSEDRTAEEDITDFELYY